MTRLQKAIRLEKKISEALWKEIKPKSDAAKQFNAEGRYEMFYRIAKTGTRKHLSKFPTGKLNTVCY